jgi:hypothetical protein
MKKYDGRCCGNCILCDVDYDGVICNRDATGWDYVPLNGVCSEHRLIDAVVEIVD